MIKKAFYKLFEPKFRYRRERSVYVVQKRVIFVLWCDVTWVLSEYLAKEFIERELKAGNGWTYYP